MFPSANETVEKWNTPTNTLSNMFMTKLPSNPRKLIEDWIVIPYGTKTILSTLFTIFLEA